MKRLTDSQKTAIQTLRSSGLGYKAISANLGLSRETMRSFCARNHIPAESRHLSCQASEERITGDAANHASEIKAGSTVFIISTCHSDHATETLKDKLGKLILDAVTKQASSFQFAQG